MHRFHHLLLEYVSIFVLMLVIIVIPGRVQADPAARAESEEADAAYPEFSYEIGFGLGYSNAESGMHGGNFSCYFGWRPFRVFGLYIEQNGGLLLSPILALHGSTMLDVRFTLPIHDWELFAGLGGGLMYTVSDIACSGSLCNGSPVPIPDITVKDIYFVSRIGIGMTYMLEEDIGIGVHIDYATVFSSGFEHHLRALRAQLHAAVRF